MRIICLQFNPQLKQLDANLTAATHLLDTSPSVKSLPADPLNKKTTWLLLPELSFTGYNFRDLPDIEPFLEVQGQGPSSQWARSTALARKWHVTVGYPERSTNPQGEPVYYNSTITYDPSGNIVAHARKRFLYYTDETWASEGIDKSTSAGFFAGEVRALGRVSMGICMDINPYKFLAPWTDYEFATHIVRERTPLAVLNMAWLTRLTPQELAEQPNQPDQETFGYWIERFWPLRQRAEFGCSTVVVCANRCGTEEGDACYAGTSSVFYFKDGRVSLFGIMGKGEEGCLVVDTDKVCFLNVFMR
jgi:protein N-terminal amidase